MIAALAGALGTVAAGAAYIGGHEGISLTSYQDAGGVWTICQGLTEGVQPNMALTQEECDARFKAEIGKTFARVDQIVRVDMTPSRRIAVASFCYNVGFGNCGRSTFIKKLNAKDPTACNEILRWKFVDGVDCSTPGNRVCPGVFKRRQEEAELCRG